MISKLDLDVDSRQCWRRTGCIGPANEADEVEIVNISNECVIAVVEHSESFQSDLSADSSERRLISEWHQLVVEWRSDDKVLVPGAQHQFVNVVPDLGWEISERNTLWDYPRDIPAASEHSDFIIRGIIVRERSVWQPWYGLLMEEPGSAGSFAIPGHTGRWNDGICCVCMKAEASK